MAFHTCCAYWGSHADALRTELYNIRPQNAVSGWGRLHFQTAGQYDEVKAAYLELRAHLGATDAQGDLTWVGGTNPMVDGSVAATLATALRPKLDEDRDILPAHYNHGNGWLAQTDPVPAACVAKAWQTYFRVRDCVDPVT